MQMANQERGENPTPSRTLEFRQAMKDFRTMFPTLDSELIECVLRSNAGHVDSTIDQLLLLSQDNGPNILTRRWNMQNGTRFHIDDDSTDSDESVPSELLDPPTSSDDDAVISIRDPPPQYTPHADDDPAGNFFGSSYPVEVPNDGKKKGWHKDGKSGKNGGKIPRKPYRAWNPPFLGQLPDDFLRILPQQFMTSSTRDDLKKPSAAPRKPSSAASPSRSNNERIVPPHGMTGPVVDSSTTNGTNNGGDDLTPPPRPPRTIPPSSRRLPQYSERDNRHNGIRPEHFEPGNLFIRPATENRNFHHHHHSVDPQRQRHHHRRSSRSSHGSRCSNSQQQSLHHQSFFAAATNGNHTRRSSDFSSRRMVMVSRRSEPVIPLSQNGVAANGVNVNDRLPSQHRSLSQRSSSNSCNHHRQNSGHQSPVFHRTELPSFSPQPRSSTRSSSASMRSRQRTSREEEQYVEDCRLAILLQNEEFIRELKRNDEFLKALEKDRPDTAPPMDKAVEKPVDKDVVPLPDPDAKYPHGVCNATPLKREGLGDPEKDDGAFQENLKHMGKSARKKFNEIAKRFSVRKKSSYKSMKNVDPVFANCDDSYEEESAPRSPVFDL